MEREIKIQYNPQRSFVAASGSGLEVGLMEAATLTALLASVSKIYVAPTGSDASDGLTTSTPVQTIGRGIALAVIGSKDAVVLRPGVHGYIGPHNTFGKKIIAEDGAKLVDLREMWAPSTPGGYRFDELGSWKGDISNTHAVTYPAYPNRRVGEPVLHTGREDMGTDAEDSNRYYYPVLTDRDVGDVERMMLVSTRFAYDGAVSRKMADTGMKVHWDVSAWTKIVAFFAPVGGISPSGGLGAYAATAGLTPSTIGDERLQCITDGTGEVMIAHYMVLTWASGVARNVCLIWHNGDIKYFYDIKALSDPLTTFDGPCNYGNHSTAMPMIYRNRTVGGFDNVTTKAIQPNKRYLDSGYEYSVLRTPANSSEFLNGLVPAIYYSGIPMFSLYADDGKCFTPQQLSDALQAAGGVFASLPTWARDYIDAEMRNRALTLFYRERGCFNSIPRLGNYSQRINPNAPFATSPRMLSTDAAASAHDPVYFESAEAMSDAVFIGGAVINARFYSQMNVEILAPADDEFGFTALTAPRTLQVAALGNNSRLQNCYIEGTDMSTQLTAALANLAVKTNYILWNRTLRTFVETWADCAFITTDELGGEIFSSQIKCLDGMRATTTRTAAAHTIKNSVFVGFYLVSERVTLWHVSTSVGVYLTLDETLVYGCCIGWMTGYYLTPDGSPMTIDYSIVKEALANNLIPPDSVVTNSMSADPLFRSFVSPYDLRLQAVAKDDFFDSPAIGFSAETSFFGGPREAGAYDESATVTVTWDEFNIIFPWTMLAEVDRTRMSNRRRDGVKSKLSTARASVKLPMAWRYALSRADLQNLEALLNADESLVRIFFNPVAKPLVYLEGHIDQTMKNGGPFGLLTDVSDQVQLDFDCAQPVTGSLYDYL